MKAVLSLCLIFWSFWASSKETPNIRLQFENLKSDSVMIGYSSFSDPNNEIADTAVVKNGVLNHHIKIKDFSNVVIIPFSLWHKFKNGKRFFLQGSRIVFFMNPDDQMDIKATIEEGCVRYSVTGNKISAQYAEFANANLEMNKEKVRYELKFNEKKAIENTEVDKKQYAISKAKDDSTFIARTLAFAAAHPDYEISPRILMALKNKDEVIVSYNKLTKDAKQSYFGKILGTMINGWFAVTPGKELPSFEASTLIGKPFKLSDLKGKYVLLDFWGSWCKPCLDEIPALKLFYEKNKNHLEIVGLICKDTKTGAINVVNKHSLTWTQLYSDSVAFGSLFGVSAYPTKILIDQKGVVVKVFAVNNESTIGEIDSLVNK